MFYLKYSKRFKQDLKYFQHDPDTLLKLKQVLDCLINGKPLSKKNYNHPLSGEFKGCFDCHIRPDVLLIYKKEKEKIFILLLRIGSHSDLF